MTPDSRPRWLRVLARLVPANRRSEWFAEWAGEAGHDDSLPTRLAAAEDAARLRLRLGGLATLRHDARVTARRLARTPVWTLAVILTLGLGLGATTAMFTVLYGVILKPLPFSEPHRLVAFEQQLTYPIYRQVRERQTGLSTVAAWANARLPVQLESQPEWVTGAFVDAALLPTLGIQPILGRLPNADEDTEHANGSVVLSHGLWSERFGGDPTVLGRTLVVDQHRFTIVGVMPQAFAFPSPRARLWLSMSRAPRSPSTWYLNVIGRVAPDLTVAEARSRLTGMELEDTSSADHVPETLHSGAPVDLQTKLRGDVAPLLVFQGAVAALLLIACVNVTNLLASRAVSREGELAVRAALGAGRAHLVRLMLIEAVVLALIGGVLGLGFARLVVTALLASVALPLEEQVGLHWPVMLAAMGLALVVGIFIGMIPAIRTVRSRGRHHITTGSRSATDSLGRHRIRTVLVASQVALALTLLVAGGLLARSFARLATLDPGFDPQGVVAVDASPPDSRYPDQAAKQRFYDALTARLRALPTVSAVSLSASVPLTGGYSNGTIELDGSSSSGRDAVRTEVQTVGPAYFSTLGIPLAAGRDFAAREADRNVVIVNRALAARYFPDGDAVGHRLRGVWGLEDQWLTIVGVVGNMRHRGLQVPLDNQIYVPYDTATWPWAMHVMIRTTSADLSSLVDRIRAIAASTDAQMAQPTIRPLSNIRDRSVADERIATLLLVSFAVASLLLAVIGTYGVTAESVRSRRREYGIRLALGARRAQLTWEVMTRAARTIAIGLTGGLAITLALSRVLESFLADLSPRDPMVIAAASLTLFGATLLATALPARQAARLDPVEALRRE